MVTICYHLQFFLFSELKHEVLWKTVAIPANGLIQGHVYTVSVWLKPAALTTYTTSFFGARDNTHWVSLLPRGHEFVNYATMVWSGQDWYDAGTGMNIPLNEWSHLAFTVDEGAIRVYIDGEQRFSNSGFPDIFTTADGIFTLGVNWWDPAYQGMMDELKIFEEALSAQEISALATP